MQSPIARKMDWQSKMIKGQADRPLAVPASAKSVTIAAALHPVAMKTIWQAAIVELPGPPRLEPMLRAQGGYLDQIGGKNAAWTPNDLFYVELGPKTLGIVRPGHRQFVHRWVDPKTAAGFTPYLKQAQQADAPGVFAIDLQDMVGPTAVRYAYDAGDLPSLDKLSEDARRPLLTALGGAKGLRLNIHAGEELRGELIVDFGSDVSAISEHAKEFVIDILKSADLYEPTVDAWQFKAKGNQIMGDGAMAPDALNRLLVLLAPTNNLQHEDAANGSAGTASSAEPAPAAPAASKNDAASASQQYYKAVSKILDTLSPKASPTASATWLIAKARQIENMPIMNVDPELLAWGNMVAESINRAAQELALGQQKAKIASTSVNAPTGYTTYSGDGSGGDAGTAESRAAYRNAQNQRRAAAQTERGAAAERALNILNALLPTRGKIRSDMTQKYGVEF
jgi:hypothetical protein